MNELIQQLLFLLETGQISKLSDISEEQRNVLHQEFNKGPFTPEQQAILNNLVFNATEKENEINEFNNNSLIHKISLSTLSNGIKVIPLSIITWAYPDQGYSKAYNLLIDMPVLKISKEDWPIYQDE